LRSGKRLPSKVVSLWEYQQRRDDERGQRPREGLGDGAVDESYGEDLNPFHRTDQF